MHCCGNQAQGISPERSRILAKRAEDELRRSHGVNWSIDFGEPFLNALFAGSFKSLADRVGADGFCQTSYGENGNIKCYGTSHYPRDAAEAAQVLAQLGLPRTGLRILAFSLDHVPTGQYYLPHVYLPGGKIRANTVQTDTPGHLCRALLRCCEAGGDRDECRRLYEKLAAICRGVWQNHFHDACGLLDAGNYNEQGFDGDDSCLMDLFTNSAMHSGLAALARTAEMLGDESGAREFRNCSERLARGMEQSLYDPACGFYRSARRLADGAFTAEENWLILYCRRWFRGRPEAWERALEKLERETSLQWGPYRLITGETPGRRFMLLGKFFAWQLAYFGRSGRQSRLTAGLRFLCDTVRQPENIFPEWWFHHRPAELHGYIRGFLEEHRGLWCAFEEDPDGDYTVDSGNCEQTAVFLYHMLNDVLGVSCRDGRLMIHPGTTGPLHATALPVGAGKEVELHWRERRLSLKTGDEETVCFSLPFSRRPARPELLVNGMPVEYTLRQGVENDFLEFSATGREWEIRIEERTAGKCL